MESLRWSINCHSGCRRCQRVRELPTKVLLRLPQCRWHSPGPGRFLPVNYLLLTEQKPLHGWWIVVKDCIRTSLGSKAYYDLFVPALQTAEALRALCRAGGTIVGTTRLSSLISKEDPTEAIDYAAPFNPRADGYQFPSGSSTGSAAAISSY